MPIQNVYLETVFLLNPLDVYQSTGEKSANGINIFENNIILCQFANSKKKNRYHLRDNCLRKLKLVIVSFLKKNLQPVICKLVVDFYSIRVHGKHPLSPLSDVLEPVI